jgi:hypothetical protein
MSKLNIFWDIYLCWKKKTTIFRLWMNFSFSACLETLVSSTPKTLKILQIFGVQKTTSFLGFANFLGSQKLMPAKKAEVFWHPEKPCFAQKL